MRIKVEPKEFFMYSVFLAFNQERPDAEDEAVKAYLAEQELIPKLQGKDTIDGQDSDVMYFGGCYLGSHLKAIEEMQRNAVQREMIAAEIESSLKGSTDPATRAAADGTSEPELKELIASLAQELHHESSFGADEEGYLKVTLEPAYICQKFVELVGYPMSSLSA